MARKRGGLRISVYQACANPSMLLSASTGRSRELQQRDAPVCQLLQPWFVFDPQQIK
jgi:hypothetical protein